MWPKRSLHNNFYKQMDTINFLLNFLRHTKKIKKKDLLLVNY